MRGTLAALAALTLLIALPGTAAAGTGRAGVAVEDATWHVGASAGQFTDETGPVADGTVDPYLHTTKKRISDGVALRTSTRALVIQGANGKRVAIVAHDLYLPQDLLLRRLASLIADHDRRVSLGLEPGPALRLSEESLAMTASHNHNTPYYSTPGWGTAIFQDVYDLRFYDYMAQQMFKAVKRAARTMRPVRMGGTTRQFDAVQSHTYGPKVGDDGTPAGQPYSHTTQQLSVMRFDDISDPARPKPFAHWVVFGVHPEWTWGYDLINGDITQASARLVDRELGTISVFSQRETGASGPHKDLRVHRPEDRREFQDNGFGQLDRGARLVADEIKAALADIESATPQRASAFQPLTSDFDVSSVHHRFAPPATRPYPGVSNCNTASLFHGDPRLPILGLPDCYSTDATAPVAGITSPMYDQLKQAGVPVPESYSATALTAVEETAAVHMMAIRIGDTIATICPCEQFTDTALNIESRLDRVDGNFWKGFDWTAHKTPAGRDWCVPGEPGMWVCANPQNPAGDLAPITDLAYRRFRAQINNDAAGWETDLATLGSEAEPYDPDKIKGNFTREEFADRGYALVLAVGMGNDYWGYTPEYREMRSHDHYRKALNGLGLHGADYLATRLSRLGASLNGGPKVEPSALDRALAAEQYRAQSLANGLGTLAQAYTTVYEKTLPRDGGKPRILTQPPLEVQRFSAAHLTWVGGSNYSDNPAVRVERKVDGAWVPYGDGTGDVQTMVRFPTTQQVTAWRQGQFEWRWTAAFEAFASDIEQADLRGERHRATPAGTYRFVVEGEHRGGLLAADQPYRLASREFTVAPWRGITAEDLRVEDDGTVSFRPGPSSTESADGHTYTFGPIDYPNTYSSPFRFIDGARKRFTYGLADPERHQWYCPRCSFRPWLDTGDIEAAVVRLGDREVAATRGEDGRWRSGEALGAGETAIVPAGGLRDAFGNTNGAPSGSVSR